VPASLTPRAAAKAYAALAVSVALAALTAWQAARDGGLTTTDTVVAVLVAALPPIGVWLAPRNADPAPKPAAGEP
jgi:hypothetical protein